MAEISILSILVYVDGCGFACHIAAANQTPKLREVGMLYLDVH